MDDKQEESEGGEVGAYVPLYRYELPFDDWMLVVDGLHMQGSFYNLLDFDKAVHLQELAERLEMDIKTARDMTTRDLII